MTYRRIILPSLLAGALSAVGMASAFAADMPMKYAPTPVAVPMLSWTGFYAGLNAGYGWASVGDTVGSNDLGGFVGGGQLGYNWQTGPVVFGLEGDFQGSSQSRSDNGVIGGVPFTVEQKMPWLATARGRIGYAFDSVMVYATGGAAWIDYKLTVSAPGGSVSDSATKSAWTAGGGVEWMLMPKWSAKVEYLYIDTGDTTVTLLGVPFVGHAKENLVRVGLNYHF